MGLMGRRNLQHWIHHLVQRRIPAQGQAQRDADDCSGAESKGNAAQRIDRCQPTARACGVSSAKPFSTPSGEGKTLVAVQSTE